MDISAFFLLCTTVCFGVFNYISCAEFNSRYINSAYIRENDLENYVNYVNNHLEVKKTYIQSQLAKGRLYLNEAKCDLAERHAKNVLEKYPDHEEALELLKQIHDFPRLMGAAKTFLEFDDIVKAIEMVNYALEISPGAKQAYELRSQLYRKFGRNDDVLIEMSTFLQKNDTEEFVTLAYLLFEREYTEEAIKMVEKCLDNDSKNKLCLSVYKKFKQFLKHLREGEKAWEERRYKDCIREAKELLKSENVWHTKARKLLCQCYAKDNQPLEAITSCSQRLAYRHDLDAYCYRAEALLQRMFSSIHDFRYNVDLALHDFLRVLEIDPHFKRAIDGQETCQKWKYIQTGVYALLLSSTLALKYLKFLFGYLKIKCS